MVYSKNLSLVDKLRQPADKTADYKLDDNDGNGPYKLDPLSARNKNIEYEYFFKGWNLRWKAPLGSYPRYSKETLRKMYEAGQIVYKKSWKEPKAKRYLNSVQQGVPPSTFWDGKEVGFNSNATSELAQILTRDAFLSPKPKSLIMRCIEITIGKNDKAIILDFMAGSGTTGHAVLELNKKNKACNQFILCTNDENKICSDVCYPRIKKVISGYKGSKNEKIEGIPSNLKYYKTSFVKKSISRDNLKVRITRECTEMLCLREGIFDEVKKTNDYRIFQRNGRIMGVYYSLERGELKSLKKNLDKMKGKKILYCFTLDPLGLDKKDFHGWKGASLEPIPQKILDVYESICEY